MKVLLTGAAGFLGKAVLKELREKGYESFPTDIVKTNRIKYLDVTQLHKVINFLASNHFTENDAIIHLAAKVAGKPSLKDPWGYFHTNILGTLNILEAMKVLKLKYLVFASSWSTYGSKIKLPIDENTPQSPENPYGASKKACEALIENYAKLYGIRAIVLRPTMIYGPNQEEQNVLQQVIEAMLTKKRFEIYGKGKHTREFLNIKDAARVFVKALEEVKKIRTWEVFILGTEIPISIAQLAKRARKLRKFPLIFKNVPTWAFSQRSDMTKIKKVFKIDPKDFTSLEEGLIECLKAKERSK